MKREEIIKKWLDNELNSQEFEAFKALDDYEELIKLSDRVQQFKAPEYNTSEALEKLLQAKQVVKQQSRNWVKPLLRVAALIVIMFSVYYYTTTLDTDISTLMAQKTKVLLPDASAVDINAASTLTYNKNNWDKQRNVTLEGEAYFKVAKGSKFNVNTASGIVTVLGTQFNVKHRDDIFEVICYEGSVGVEYNAQNTVLKPGDSFLIINGKVVAAKEKNSTPQPSWINNLSYFKSLPFEYVINEFERQYNVSIATQGVDIKQLFTGSFVHNNKALALKAITLPLNLKYNIKDDNSIELTRE